MQPKFPLFSEVVLLQDLPIYNLKRGSVATVVEHYAMGELEQSGYSLEGFNVPNVTIEVAESQIISIEQWQKEMEILEKLHRLSVVKLVHLESYIEKLLSEENNDMLKVS
ncbi:DUF4926 domain-containing protein [Dolichospermum sp. ST_con]|nr:DUF4926 domain-containing protein [Dolichospermum sp. ST_con]MDD1419201.1 DUF4926 domain-containing protein [Dolichospermum sp. ST_sed1]MDD1425316.1 DUF4926 domain-containing protein [Dolichospermum sp. ST_sed9]MDD1431548.1 DUF4926 domain-containing protein [Dolichospermum sp. ST_sed6]MDD1437439.1 DUF4926 domain-containing protein [Dolichospermum sp. ST_sed10]MDD1441001.1 DUF4926 domain-containing protein [Dolichospermum sp. ST_sed3]MDD1446052.1 DUF4926 domain-containing protein [Dolichosp